LRLGCRRRASKANAFLARLRSQGRSERCRKSRRLISVQPNASRERASPVSRSLRTRSKHSSANPPYKSNARLTVTGALRFHRASG
jgi:hypothetical protein